MRITLRLQNLGILILFVALTGIPVESAKAMQDLPKYTSAEMHRVTVSDVQEMFYKTEFNEKISVAINNETLEQALRKIAKATGLKLTYRGDIMADKKVTLKRNSISVSDALSLVLDGTGLDYRFSESGYLLIGRKVDKNSSLMLELISGQVTDAVTGESLPGVNVVVKGTTTGVATGTDGTFELDVPSLQDTLVISFVGYQTLEVPVDGRTSIDIELVPAAIMGEEMVVVGYGSQRAQEITSSISTVNSDNLNPVASSSINQMLRGKAAGLNLSQVTAQPGGNVSVNIRGDISPGGSGSPLYVIDGVPITEYSSTVPGLEVEQLGFRGGIDRDPLSYMNPSDIESVSVLKDASATAIYGSAAANGVVLITTKDGTSGDIQVEYRGSFTSQTPHEYFPLLNEKEFMQQQDRLAHDRYLYENRIAPYGDTDPSSIAPYEPFFTESEISAGGQGTDWLDLVTERGYINEHNLSLSGGSENTVVYGSFNYQGNDGVLRNSTLNRYSGRINLDQYITDFIHLNVKTTASRMTGSNASSGSNSGGPEKYNMLQAAYSYAPTVGVHNEDGSYASTYDPLVMNPAAFLAIDDEGQTDHFFTAPKLVVDITDNLTANVIGQIDVETTNRSFYLPRVTNNAQLPDGMAQKANDRLENYTTESYVNYRNDFENSNLTVTAGAGYYKSSRESFGLQAVGFFTDAFSYNNVGVASNIEQNDLRSNKSERVKISQFARVNYSLLDRYMLSLSLRRDGSSIFAENHKYGYFPGGSVAWRISEENFMQNIPSISDLKVRVSYGMAGNESVLQGNSLQLYSSGFNALIGNTQYNGVALAQLANPDLTWEKNYTFNLGLDFGLFSNRIQGNVDYFVKTAEDLLDFNPLPSNNAVGRVADNVGTTQSKGFEVSLNTRNVEGDIFRWTSGLNVSYYEARWLERNPRTSLSDYIDPTGAMDTWYGWETDGIIKSESEIPSYMPDAFVGNVKYIDQNGDGELNGDDVVKLGHSRPRWNVGLDNTFSYRNFDLNVYLYGNFDFLRSNNYAPGGGISSDTDPSNTTIFARDIFSASNPDGRYPGVANNPYSGNNPAGSDFNLYDASFLRISDVSLSYSLPSDILGSNVRRARMFINLQDLGVISNYPGFDPELTEANPYPRSISTTVGVELNF